MPRILLVALVTLGLLSTAIMMGRSGPAPASAASAVASPSMQLYANGWDTTYRDPFGAAPTDSKVTLRLRSSKAVTAASLFLVTQSGSTSRIAMQANANGTRTKMWSATPTMPSKAQQMTYYFRAQAGRSVRWYSDGGLFDGGVGQTYPNQSDVIGYELTVYLNSFHTPSWMEGAVIYQIFPDRFYDGNKANDRLEKTGTQYGYIDTYFHKNWNATPFDGGNCGWSQCYSSDFYGGDLQGVIDKLPYLHTLGVNVIYLNPIFLAPSDHKYDTSNFMKIDPEFGTLQTFQTLVKDAKADGIRLILDGVFEDTSSDSMYFNEYGAFPGLGAYQSKRSQYYPWYTFYQWPQSYNEWGGYSFLPLLKESAAVENYIFKKPGSVAQYWLQQGAAGWRLDSANALSPTYWRAFRRSIKSAYPDSVIIAEPSVWTGDATPMLLGDQWDGVMNYRFREWALDFFAHGAGAQNPSDMNATGFLESEMGLLAETPRPAAMASMNLVDSHDTIRILTALQGSKGALKLLALYQMTWVGAPTILYGDETGVQGVDANTARATFPWQHQDTSLEGYYARIIHMRLKYDALTQGSVLPLYVSDGKRIVAYLRQSGSQRIVVVLNDSGKTQNITVPLTQVANETSLTDILHGGTLTVKSEAVTMSIPALSGKVLLAS